MTSQIRAIPYLLFGSVMGFYALLNCAAFGQVPPKDLIQRVDSAEHSREIDLAGYTVVEHYTFFRNGGTAAAADAIVNTVYKKGEGKAYNVGPRSGSLALKNFALDRILDGEKEISKGDARQGVLVTSANYKMEFEKAERLGERNCFVLKLIPRRKSAYLIEGQAWVDSQNYHLVRIKGKTSGMPSILVGHPLLQRDYEEFQGFALATCLRSESKNLFFGTTVMNIAYEGYHIEPPSSDAH